MARSGQEMERAELERVVSGLRDLAGEGGAWSPKRRDCGEVRLEGESICFAAISAYKANRVKGM